VFSHFRQPAIQPQSKFYLALADSLTESASFSEGGKIRDSSVKDFCGASERRARLGNDASGERRQTRRQPLPEGNMQTTKRFITLLLCALLSAPATLAQNPQRDSQTDKTASQDVLIIIGQQQVRFTSQKPVQEMQLQIFNQVGELVHDSGLSYGPEINWPLQSADGQSLKSGLYAYTLSIKEQGAETARVRRGHFIVDRAGDRDKTGDRLWITSQNENGVGVEMTVARGEENTVAGVEAPAERTVNGGGVKRDESGRNVESETESGKQKLEASLAAATPGQLAQFTAGGQLGDSGVTVDANGRVGVGTSTPQSRLDVVGNWTGEQGALQLIGDKPTLRFTGGGISGNHSWILHQGSDGPGNLQFFRRAGAGAWDHIMTMTPSGKVGIGSNNPSHQLRLGLGPLWTTNGWGGSLELENGSAIGWRSNTAGQRFGIGRTNGGLFFFRTPSELGTRNAAPTYDFLINDDGRFGIGTTSLTASKMTVEGQDAMTLRGFEPYLTLQDSNRRLSHRIQSAHGDLNFFSGIYACLPNGPFNRTCDYFYDEPSVVIKDGGNVGIGTPLPQAKLHVNGNAIRFENGGKVLSIQTGTEVDVLSPTNSLVLQSLGPNGRNHVVINPFPADGPGPYHNGNVGIGTFVPQAKLHVIGTTMTSVLQITGGADFAENFEVNLETAGGEAMPAKVEPGMVVSIDPASPGKLTPSTQAYDRRVAGIISGAGGVRPGMIMSQEGTLADGKHPVALSGRVYCWVDASSGVIEPGDLLTTSGTPGHAMKVADANKAQGAIIGKAMTGLKEGKGLVLVLVTLQ
jgi:hypothetical protein